MLEWVRPPQQARTRKTLSRLLDAAEAAIAENGFEEAGIAEIAKRAGSSVGGFYRRFRDKQGLLHALHERFCEEAEATADDALDPERWHGASIAEIVDAVVDFLVRIYREKEGFFRAFLTRGTSDAAVRERSLRVMQHVTVKLAGLLRERAEQVRHGDFELAVAFGLHVVFGALDHTVLGYGTSFGLGDERLAPELSRVLLGYLGAREISS